MTKSKGKSKKPTSRQKRAAEFKAKLKQYGPILDNIIEDVMSEIKGGQQSKYDSQINILIAAFMGSKAAGKLLNTIQLHDMIGAIRGRESPIPEHITMLMHLGWLLRERVSISSNPLKPTSGSLFATRMLGDVVTIDGGKTAVKTAPKLKSGKKK